jgi:hypothetical protein
MEGNTMPEIALPSGATVTLRDPKSFKQKDRRKIYEAIDGEATVATGLAMQDALISVLVESWSLDLVPPSIKIDSLGELDLADYDRLAEAAQESMSVIFPAFSQVSDDPKAPTSN